MQNTGKGTHFWQKWACWPVQITHSNKVMCKWHFVVPQIYFADNKQGKDLQKIFLLWRRVLARVRLGGVTSTYISMATSQLGGGILPLIHYPKTPSLIAKMLITTKSETWEILILNGMTRTSISTRWVKGEKRFHQVGCELNLIK